MRICYILASKGGVGGLEKHVKELAYGMQKRGNNVVIIADPEYESYFKELQFVPFSFRSRRNPFTYIRLFKVLKKLQPNIIHAQANKAMHILSTLKPFLPYKIVGTIHNIKSDLKSFLKADAVIGVSQRVLDQIEHPNRYVIYNGVDIDIPKVAKEPNTICAIGRFVEAKGFDLLLNAMQKLPDKKLYLIGDGDEELKEFAKKQENVILCGYLSQKEVYEKIAMSQLVVIPSRKEGFSYVFLEALMLEVPIVATDFADIKEFIPKKWIVDAREEDIANKIKLFFNNYDKHYQEFVPYFKKVRSECTLESMVDKTLKVYKEVLDV